MAEIRIEEKPRGGGSLWAWILGLVVVGLLIWFLADVIDRDDDDVDDAGTNNTEMMDDSSNYANEDTTTIPER